MKGSWFVVTGSTSGLGRAIANRLIREGACVVINARGEENLESFHKEHPEHTIMLPGDITTDAVISQLVRIVRDKPFKGIVINASGPPVSSFMDTEMSDWDSAYSSLLRWKVKLTRELLDELLPKKYGRFLFIESAAVRQPVDRRVLSNSLRMAVVGFVKTLSQEVAAEGITANILAPGYHDTPAMERLFENTSLLLGISPEEAVKAYARETKVGHLGNADDFASLAVWLLSPLSAYVTGQTIAVDRGLIKSSL